MRRAGLALGLALATLSAEARGQILDEVGGAAAPAAPPPAGPAPPSGPRADAAPPGATTELDERSAAQKEGTEPFCASCVVLGIAAGLAVATIPLAALAEKASRTKDELDRWVKTQPAQADLGFVVGYGFAAADRDQTRFTIAAAVMGGLTGAALITGVVLLFTKERSHARMVGADAPLQLAPWAAPGQAGAALRGSF